MTWEDTPSSPFQGFPQVSPGFSPGFPHIFADFPRVFPRFSPDFCSFPQVFPGVFPRSSRNFRAFQGECFLPAAAESFSQLSADDDGPGVAGFQEKRKDFHGKIVGKSWEDQLKMEVSMGKVMGKP